MEFNVELGYTCFDHGTFRMIDGVRVYKNRDCTKNFRDPTQAGISLIWTIVENK